ncbi:MAG: AAA family ATPase [Deltaproteobacteria bacterium]|jgi:chromosome segregation protein|nr:AAA family ATPase [Deltaproteobacteria bacterium]
MYLKRLEIVGFKSFTERTSVVLAPGISAVVGPNGCGKSNIIDAIRWVMGEQSPRLLRAKNMEDLLFNGSVGRSAASVAEVTLTLSRGGGERAPAEVSVTRRLYRGGDSEYLINRVPCRLKDLVRLFIEAGMGTRAYNIIEQEKVGRLVDAPPEERRLLIDEAAGITRFKEQKKESERRLESAETNLATAATLMGEAHKRLLSVARAAAKALKWRELRERLREFELIVMSRRFLSLQDGRAGLAAKVLAARAGLTLMEAGNEEIEAAVDALRLEDELLSSRLEEELGAWHEMRSAAEQRAREIEHLDSDIRSAAARQKSADDDLGTLDSDRARHDEEKARLSLTVADLENDSREAEETKRDLRERWLVLKNDCDRLAADRDKAARELERGRDDLGRLGETLAGAASLTEHLTGRGRALELEQNQADRTLAEARERTASRTRFRTMLEEDLEGAREELAGRREELLDARRALEAEVRLLGEAERDLAAIGSQVETLENLKDSGFGWYPDGSTALLKDPEAKGLVGPVAERLNIPDGYEEAAEAALGERLGWIMAEDREACLAALLIARRKNLGRCVLVSQEDLDGGDLAKTLLGPLKLVESAAGGHDGDDDGPGVDAAQILKAFDKKHAYLTRDGDYLGPVHMAGSGTGGTSGTTGTTGTGAAAGPGGDGGKQQASPRGKKRGGGGGQTGQTARAGGPAPAGRGDGGPDSPGRGLLARIKELDALRARLGDTEDRVAEAGGRVAAKRTLLNEADEALAAADNRTANLTADLADANAKLMVAKSDEQGLAIRRQSLEGEMERARAELADNMRRRAAAAEEKASLETGLAGLEDAWRRAAAEAESRNEELEQLREHSQAAASQADAYYERLEGARRELSRVSDWLDNLEGRQASLETLAVQLAAAVEEMSQKKAGLLLEAETSPETLKEAEEKVAAIRESISGLRSRIAEAEEKAKAARRAREAAASELAGLEKELLESGHGLAKIEDDLLRDWRVVLVDPSAPVVEDVPPELAGDDGDSDDDSGDSDDDFDDSDDDSGDSDDDDDEDSEDDDDGDEDSEDDDDADSADLTEAGAAPEPSETSGADEVRAAPPQVVDPRDYQDRELPPLAESTILKLREKILAMGDVNQEAIAEEEELRGRYEFYKTQNDDLTAAISDLRAGIARINQTCRQRFSETFELANQKFKEIFPVLFEGGEGWLSLTNESDPLESGVEIHVHPPGKKITVMRSLSGGEKTLTSLCLIFALYLIKPSPFCLLDEADAPLDEANIDRFNRLLRNLSGASQIIMVTHNKRTMQISDTLYGVTMETPGVSRLVSVNLSEAEGLTDA